MNFFALEDAEINLPAVTLRGLVASEVPSALLRIWLPFVRSTHVPKMIHGITAVKSINNVGEGAADLIILPLRQYRRGNRVFKGLKKGFASFMKKSTLETAKLGTKLAFSTQKILEQTDELIYGREETLHSRVRPYPASFTEGILAARETLGDSAKTISTIIAVPMRVYERDGASGAIRSVLRAMPIMMLRGLVGVSEATGQALCGVRNAMEPNRALEVRSKYKNTYSSAIDRTKDEGDDAELCISPQ